MPPRSSRYCGRSPNTLLGLERFESLETSPRLGASWEGFVLEQVLAVTGDRHAYYWGTQSGAEIDLLLTIGGRRYGVEVKYADAPRLTRSMRIAMADLGLSRLYVVYPGGGRYHLGEGVEAPPLAALLRERGRPAPGSHGVAGEHRGPSPYTAAFAGFLPEDRQ